MMTVLLVVVLILVVLVGGVLALLFAIARSQRQKMASDNEVMPGSPTRAPSSWARSHDPEARLHRRLRDAMTGLRAVNAYATAASVNLRAGLEQAALALDDQLVAVAAVAPAHRQQQLSSVTAAVEAVEAGVAQYAAAATAIDMTALETDLASVQSQLDTIATLRQGLGRA